MSSVVQNWNRVIKINIMASRPGTAHAPFWCHYSLLCAVPDATQHGDRLQATCLIFLQLISKREKRIDFIYLFFWNRSFLPNVSPCGFVRDLGKEKRPISVTKTQLYWNIYFLFYLFIYLFLFFLFFFYFLFFFSVWKCGCLMWC